MAAVQQLKVKRVDGNAEAGTYALSVRLGLSFSTGDEAHILVKRYGASDVSFDYIFMKESSNTLSQRACESAEISGAKALIDDHSPKALTKVSENCYRYQAYEKAAWCVDHVGQKNQRFFVAYQGGERELIPAELLAFKAVLGIENFDADYIKPYQNSMTKATGKG